MRYPIFLALLLTTLITLCSTAWSFTFQQEHPVQGNMNYVSPQGASQSSLFMDTQQHHFLPVDTAFQPHVWQEKDRVWVLINIHPGYYLYRHRIQVSSPDNKLTLGALTLPKGIIKQDRFMGKVQVYRHRLLFSVPIIQTQSRSTAPHIVLAYQGCADAGLCYPPEHKTLEVQQNTLSHEAALPLQQASSDNTTHSRESIDSPLTAPTQPSPTIQSGDRATVTVWQLGILFIAGIGLVFTPCVLPMLPIVAALVVGQSNTMRRSLWLSLCYVGGMVVMYTLVGMVIGLVGAGLNLQARLQSPWVVVPFAGLFVLLAFFTLEWIRLPTLGIGQKASRLEEKFRQLGPLGLVIAGALSTLIISPCLSAPLAGVLTYISTTGNAVAGGLSLLVLALGMGIPLILVCVFGSGILPQRGAWMERVRHLSAVILLGVALWLVSAWLPNQLVLLLEGWLALMAGLMLGAFQSSAPMALRAAALILIMWGSTCVIGLATGKGTAVSPLALTSHPAPSLQETSTLPTYDNAMPTSASVATEQNTLPQAPHFTTITTLAELHELQKQAREQHRPLMLDLYADWCVSCKRMEAELFPKDIIAKQLARFTLVRFDMTRNNTDARSLLMQYHLFGPPSILFFVDGNELPSLRLQGEPSSQQFLSVLTRVQKGMQQGS